VLPLLLLLVLVVMALADSGFERATLAQGTELTAKILHAMKDKGEAEYGGSTASLSKNAAKTDRLATLTMDALEVERARWRVHERRLPMTSSLHPLCIRRAIRTGCSQASRSVQFF
jgi:hypothetical protein